MTNIDFIQDRRVLQWTRVTRLVLSLPNSLLDKLFEAMNDNPSKDAPYHGNHHQMAVALRCMDLMNQEVTYLGRYSSKPTPASHWVSQINPVILFIAASLHDWGHSQGNESDDYNISIASDRLRSVLTGEVEDEKSIEEAISLIQITRYPFVKEPSTLMECIIRDADLMMVLEDDADYFMEGLAIELGKDPVGFKEANVKWLAEQKLYTHTGKALLDAYIQEHM